MPRGGPTLESRCIAQAYPAAWRDPAISLSSDVAAEGIKPRFVAGIKAREV